MPIIGSRTRLLTIRLTETEYDIVRRVCTNEGIRSLSDFARAAILERTQFAGLEKTSLTGDLNTLGSQLVRVDEAIKSLSSRIERVLGRTTE
jgi:hypothetical protein